VELEWVVRAMVVLAKVWAMVVLAKAKVAPC
jgi:hypothetical protein